MSDRGPARIYLAVVIVSLGVWLGGQWAVATYDPADYAASALVGLFILVIEIIGLYAAFRLYQLRHAP